MTGIFTILNPDNEIFVGKGRDLEAVTSLYKNYYQTPTNEKRIKIPRSLKNSLKKWGTKHKYSIVKLLPDDCDYETLRIEKNQLLHLYTDSGIKTLNDE